MYQPYQFFFDNVILEVKECETESQLNGEKVATLMIIMALKS